MYDFSDWYCYSTCGISSMYANTDPLIIVDGAPYSSSLSSIAQSDIESVTVLKDAASAALYGARGASGVIIVTTKRNTSKDAVINVDMKWGVNSRAIQDYDVITDPGAYYEAGYAQLYNRYFYGQGMSAEAANLNANTEMLKGLSYNVFSYPEGEQLIGMDGKLNPNATLGRKISGNNQEYWLQPDDWTDAAYKTSLRQEYNVSVNGGTEKSNYYTSVGYLNQDGIVDNSGFERITARVKADYQARKWLKLGANIGFQHSTQEMDAGLGTSTYSNNLFYYTSMIAPIYPIYVRTIDADGNIRIATDQYGHKAYDYGVAATGYGISRPFGQTGNPLGSNQYNKYENIGSHRVDRIAEQPEILDEPAVPPKAGFSVEKYVKTTFRMYNAPRKEVELLCDNGVMDAIIDQFGPDVHTYAGDLQNFRVIEEVAVGKVFFNWIFGFEGKVRIKAPADVKEQYRQMVENAAKVL